MKNYLKIYIRYSAIGFLMFAVVMFSVLKCHAQDTRKVRDEYIINGKPTFTPPTVPAYSDDLWNKQVWKFQNKTVGWILETDSAIIKVRLGLSEKGDKGDPGVCPNCPPSGGVFPFIVVIPIGSQATLQQAGIPVTNYPGISVSTSDLVDWANIQYALKQQEQTNKPIHFVGFDFYVHKAIFAGKYQKFLNIEGNFAAINVTNQNEFTVLDRPDPVDMNDANIMIQSVWRISNLSIRGQGKKQIGIEPGPTYGNGTGSLFSMIQGDGLKTAIHLRFCLNATIYKPGAADSFNGWIVDNLIGVTPGATATNSQSNATQIIQPRYYGNSALMTAIREAYPDSMRHAALQEYYRGTQADMAGSKIAVSQSSIDVVNGINQIVSNMRVTSGGGVAVGVYAASAVVIDGLICEGFSVGAAIDVDGLGATTVKDITIKNYLHFECVNGASDAIVKVRLLGGVIIMENPINHYPAIMLDAGYSTGGGYIRAQISQINWYVPKNGKLWNNAGNVNFDLINCENMGTTAQATALVQGVPTIPCSSNDGCGTNYLRLINKR